MAKWPLKYRLWRRLHLAINGLAWRLVPTTSFSDPDNKHKHWLWRLNRWVARHYTTWWITVGRKQ